MAGDQLLRQNAKAALRLRTNFRDNRHGLAGRPRRSSETGFFMFERMKILLGGMMKKLIGSLVVSCFVLTAAPVKAADQTSSTGTLIVVPAASEIRVANDQARLVFSAEEQDADAAIAASRLNARMTKSTGFIRLQLPEAVLQTRAYSTYPIYADPARSTDSAPRKPVAWRIAQSLEIRTTDLEALPRLVAKLQETLDLSSVGFELSPAAMRKADEARIAGALGNLHQRIASIARGLAQPAASARLESIEFEATPISGYVPMARSLQATTTQKSIAEPRFEPGQTVLPLSLTAKVRFPR